VKLLESLKAFLLVLGKNPVSFLSLRRARFGKGRQVAGIRKEITSPAKTKVAVLTPQKVSGSSNRANSQPVVRKGFDRDRVRRSTAASNEGQTQGSLLYV